MAGLLPRVCLPQDLFGEAEPEPEWMAIDWNTLTINLGSVQSPYLGRVDQITHGNVTLTIPDRDRLTMEVRCSTLDRGC